MLDILTAVFVIVDDFCQFFEIDLKSKSLSDGKLLKETWPSNFTISEMVTVCVSFHLSSHAHLKGFFKFLKEYHLSEFPRLPSYSRFIELQPLISLHLFAFFNAISGSCSGTSYIDSTALPVCGLKREFSHAVFKDIAQKGRTTMGWFFGFKLHLAMNHYGQIISFSVTSGNTHDASVVPDLTADLVGKIFGDKGYIGKKLFADLFSRGLQLITNIKSNMKPQILPIDDSQKLGKRSHIESAFNMLKNTQHINHTRHRSPTNFFVNILSALAAYSIRFITKFLHVSKGVMPPPCFS